MAIVVRILYEDQFGPQNRFGLHRFLLRCACDDCEIDDTRLYMADQCLDCIPKKGNSKLLATIRQELAHLSHGNVRVIAVFDNDKVRDLLALPADVSDESVVHAITDGQDHAALRVILLKENAESILQWADECGANFDPADREAAVRRKELGARDALFGRITASAKKTIRDCIREKMPSLGPLIDTIANILRPIPELGAGAH